MVTNIPILKKAALSFADKVRQMRMLQAQYFRLPPGHPDKPTILAQAQRAEKEVDLLLRTFNQTVEAL